MVPRRYIHSEPTSRLAIWARRIAGFAFVASLLAVIVVRSGLLEIKPALATFAGALAIAVLALLVAFAAFVMIWMEGLAGMGAALSAMAISLLLLAYPGYLGTKAYRLPWIYDITTDPIDRHQCDRAGDLRRRARGGQQAPLARGRGARPPGRTPRGPHRGGGAHGDHGLSRRRRDPGARRARRRARRCALLLALRLVRFRHQRRAHPQPDERDRGRHPRAKAGAAADAAAGQGQERGDRQEGKRTVQAVRTRSGKLGRVCRAR